MSGSVQTRALSGGSAGALSAYFAEGRALATYYADSGGKVGSDLPDSFQVFSAGQISGRAAPLLGLDRGLTAGMMRSLLEGKHLTTGEQLTHTRGAPVYERDPDKPGQYLRDEDGNKIRALDADGKPKIDRSGGTQGIEVISAAPKSVDVLMIIADDNLRAQIVAAHEAANAEMLAWMQDNVRLGKRTIKTPTEVREMAGAGGPTVTKGVRKGKKSKMQGSRTERVAVDLAVMSVTQFCSRPTQATVDRGAPPDALLHTHNLIAQCGWDSVAGKWVKLDEYGLREKNAAVAGAARYAAALHRNLRDIGIETEIVRTMEEDRDGRVEWRVKGITEEAERFYSSNKERIPAIVAEWEAKFGRVASPAMINKLLHDTKLPKDLAAKVQDSNPDWSLWAHDARAHNIPLASEELLRAMTRPMNPVAREPFEQRRAELLRRLFEGNGRTSKGLTADRAYFTTHEATSSLARAAEGLDFTPEELDQLELEVLDATVPIDDVYEADGMTPRNPVKVRRTTRSMLEMETRVKVALHHKATSDAFTAAPPESVAAALLKSPKQLDDEQRRVVDAVTSSAGLVLVEGEAGTGKTTAMAPAIDAMKTAGVIDQVVVVSTAARTAASTRDKLSADAGGSIELITHQIQAGRLKITSRTLVIVDEAYMVDTARADTLLAAIPDARLVCIADREQAQPIGPAGWYLDAVGEHGALLPLTNVHRQIDPEDIAATKALREGRGAEAVASWERRDRLRVFDDSQGTFDYIGERYTQLLDEGYSPRDVTVLNGGSNAGGDHLNRLVQATRIARGDLNGERFVSVEATDANRGWKLYAGDPVIFLEPYRSGREHVANGLTGTVRAVDPETNHVSVALDDGRTVNVELAPSAPSQPLAPAYCVHTLKYQGGETRIGFYVPGDLGIIDRHGVYSAQTRAIERSEVLLDRETHGLDARDNFADAIADGAFPRSASNLLDSKILQPPAGPDEQRSARSLVTDTHTAASNERRTAERQRDVIRSKARDDARAARLAAVIGKEAATKVRSAPAWPALQRRLNALEANGLDAAKMLASAARADQRSLDTARDSAAVLVARLKTVSPIPKSRPDVGERGPVRSELVPPWVERGPRPSRRNDDRMEEVRRLAEEWRHQASSDGQRLDRSPEDQVAALREAAARARQERIQRARDDDRGRGLGLSL